MRQHTFHECGHAWAALSFGSKVLEIDSNETHPHCLSLRTRDLEDWLVVLYAAGISDNVYSPERRSPTSTGDLEDAIMVETFLRAEGRFLDHVTKRAARERALNLVHVNRAGIHWLAETLENSGGRLSEPSLAQLAHAETPLRRFRRLYRDPQPAVNDDLATAISNHLGRGWGGPQRVNCRAF